MPDPLVPAPSIPATLDRAALERVLARAAELNAGALEPAEQMTEAQLVALGQEVGISAEHVRQAIAEERTRVTVPEATGIVGGWFGATAATASRIVSGTPATILAALDQWMQREEMLRPRRRYTDRLTWEARRDMVGNLVSGLNFTGRNYALKGAGEVGATVVAIDAQRCLVRLDADLAAPRQASVRASVAVSLVSLAGAAGTVATAAAATGGSIPLASAIGAVMVALGLGATAGIGAAQRRKVAQAQLSLDQVLDRLEHGELRRPGNPLADLISTITR